MTRTAFIYGTGTVLAASLIFARLFIAWLNDPAALVMAMSDGLFLCH
jgi:hypothetical protein